jgi:hypothetical protein
MLSSMRVAKAQKVGAVVLTSVFLTLHAQAQPPTDDPVDEPVEATREEPLPDATAGCLAAFSDGQRHRREGHLLAARGALIACSQPQCPDEIVNRCTPWLREVKDSIPTVIMVARDADDRDVTRVSVSVDGVLVSESLSGRPLELDPGPHEFLFEPAGHPPIEMTVVVAFAEKNRMVIARLSPPPTAASPPPLLPTPAPPSPAANRETDSEISPWAWVGLSVAGAGIIGGTVTGALALTRANELEERCNGFLCNSPSAPNPNADLYDEAVRLSHASTGLFIVGGAGALFGLAAFIWLGDDDPTAKVSFSANYVGVDGQF